MPQPSKLQSGLGRVAQSRDWTPNVASSDTTISDGVIEWPPSPERPPRRAMVRSSLSAAIREGLKSVQKSKPQLEESTVLSESPLVNNASHSYSQSSSSTSLSKTSSCVQSGAVWDASQKGLNKRLSDGKGGPTMKKRVVSDNLDSAATATASAFARSSSISSSSQVFIQQSSSSSSGVLEVKLETLPTAVANAIKQPARPAKVFLSQEQLQILKLVEDGQSVFYTGSAGTGKSVLLREIIKTLKKAHSKSPDAVAITASTGIAACNIGGVTIHSFSGIGLGVETAEQLATKVKKNKKASGRWLRTKCLIIDEVSMVDGDLFDKLARIGSILRKKSEPFGGIQLVVTGDFFQLPPVMRGGSPKFAFEAQLWKSTIKRTFNLTKVFRQTDQEFVDMLNEMRFGRLSQKSINKFRSLSREIDYGDGIGPTELFPRREEVDNSNKFRMKRLDTEYHTYRASDGGSLQDVNQREKMLANFMACECLELKVDSQVMLIKNMDETLVNGSMGKVVRFQDPGAFREDTPAAEMAAANGAGGAAAKKKMSSGAVWPIVSFVIPGSHVPREVMIQPESFKVELPNGEVQVSRIQLPLILAWAMSIHKSQGQTLERVKVDLGKVFEKGQAYVALSRATSLQGLQVLNFDPKKVNAHPKVVEWSETLEVVES